MLLANPPLAPAAAGLPVMICVPCLLVGGTETHTIALASALKAAGCAVSVCCYFEHDPITLQRLQRCGVEVDLLRLERATGRRVAAAAGLVSELTACIRRRQPQIVHVQYMAPGALPVIVARAAGVPHVVATVHVTAGHYGNRLWLPRRVAAPLCDAFICVSEVAERSFFNGSSFFREDLWRAGRRHFTIHNCVDFSLADSIRAEGASDALAARLGLGGDPVVGIVGRLDRFKGHDYLLAAFARLLPEFPRAKLLCVGDGGWGEHLRRESTRLGLDRHVIWAGRMSQADAFRHVMLMDVVAMPSRPCLEGFGLAAAEAMALGKPVVASDVDGLAEVVGRDGAGRLVPAEDVPALAMAIGQLLSSAADRRAVGHAGRRRVEQLFSPELFAARHLRLYRSVRSGR